MLKDNLPAADELRTRCLRPAGLRGAYMNEGHTRRTFAAAIGVPEQCITRLERGHFVHPKKAKKVADHFGLRVTDLIDLDAIANAHGSNPT